MSATSPSPAAQPSTGLWRTAAVLAIAHVVLLFGSFTLQKVAPLDADSARVAADHVRHSMTMAMTGGYLTLLSMLVFLLVGTLLALLLRGGTETSRWSSAVMATTAAIYVSINLTVVLASLGVASYDGHHGAPLPVVTALDHLHWFGVFLGTAVLGLFTCAVGAAAVGGRLLPRWLGWSGLAVGLACVLSVPGAGTGLVDLATLVWTLWFVALAVSAWRSSSLATAPRA